MAQALVEVNAFAPRPECPVLEMHSVSVMQARKYASSGFTKDVL